MEKIFDIAKDKEQSWGTLATAIDGNFDGITTSLNGKSEPFYKSKILVDKFNTLVSGVTLVKNREYKMCVKLPQAATSTCYLYLSRQEGSDSDIVNIGRPVIVTGSTEIEYSFFAPSDESNLYFLFYALKIPSCEFDFFEVEEGILNKMQNIPMSYVKEINEYYHDDTKKGYYYKLTQGVGGIAPLEPSLYSGSGSRWECIRLPVSAGSICAIATKGSDVARGYAITDESMKIIEVADVDADTLNEPKIVTINENGYLYINNLDVNEARFKVKISIGLDIKIDNLVRESELIKEKTEELDRRVISPRYKNNPYPKNISNLKILAIGNSYTVDGTAYLGDIVEKSGADLSKCCLYRIIQGSSSFETWVDKYKSSETVKMDRLAGTYSMGKTSGSLKELLAQDWDIIVIQQVSTLATKFDKWEPSLKEYMEILRRNCINQNMCIGFHLIHAYWTGYGDAPVGIARYNEIVNSVKRLVQEVGIDLIIPSGTAIQNARNTLLQTEYDITRDGSHLSYGVGRYLSACTWFQVLFAPFFNKSILGNTSIHIVTEEEKEAVDNKYGAVDVTEENKSLCQECAFGATLDMYNVTDINESL
jgi:hypothetical protein|nr:MAG TPA: protein of unknown function (DUF4886) [Caudoviricetes sp.]